MSFSPHNSRGIQVSHGTEPLASLHSLGTQLTSITQSSINLLRIDSADLAVIRHVRATRACYSHWGFQDERARISFDRRDEAGES